MHNLTGDVELLSTGLTQLGLNPPIHELLDYLHLFVISFPLV